jgi:hypothetical protein
MVKRPSAQSPGPLVTFGTLSVTGGIVNAYNAVKMADDASNTKPRP